MAGAGGQRNAAQTASDRGEQIVPYSTLPPQFPHRLSILIMVRMNTELFVDIMNASELFDGPAS
jgi:hypothetical protein